MNWVEVIVSILTGLAALIPLVVKLVEYIQKYIKEKNWVALLDMVMKLMEQAETKFENSEDRKQWVLCMVKASSDTINYDINMTQVGDLIDALCKMSKKVNAPVEEEKNKK
jgi:hypothetical protein